MKITKRQLKRIIKEEKAQLLREQRQMQMTDSGERIYEEIEAEVMAIIDNVIKVHGADDIVIEAAADALRDLAVIVENDYKITRGY